MFLLDTELLGITIHAADGRATPFATPPNAGNAGIFAPAFLFKGAKAARLDSFSLFSLQDLPLLTLNAELSTRPDDDREADDVKTAGAMFWPWLPVTARDGATRTKDNVYAATALVYDFDDGAVSLDDLLSILADFSCCITESFSSSPVRRKYHIVFPLNCAEVVIDAREFKTRYLAVAQQVFGADVAAHIDASSATVGRPFFLPPIHGERITLHGTKMPSLAWRQLSGAKCYLHLHEAGVKFTLRDGDGRREFFSALICSVSASKGAIDGEERVDSILALYDYAKELIREHTVLTDPMCELLTNDARTLKEAVRNAYANGVRSATGRAGSMSVKTVEAVEATASAVGGNVVSFRAPLPASNASESIPEPLVQLVERFIFVPNRGYFDTKSRAFVTKADFKDRYGDVDITIGGKTVSAFSYARKHALFRRVDGEVFYPYTIESPDFRSDDYLVDLDGATYFNTFAGWLKVDFDPPPDVKAQLDLILDYFAGTICKNTEYPLDYLAQAITYPQEKSQVSIILCGQQGIGKSLFAGALASCVFGRFYRAPSPYTFFSNPFNQELEDSLWIFFDEYLPTGGREWERAKSYITDTNIRIERKGFDAQMRRFYGRFVFAANPDNEAAIDAVISAQERRFFCVDLPILRKPSSFLPEAQQLLGKEAAAPDNTPLKAAIRGYFIERGKKLKPDELRFFDAREAGAGRVDVFREGMRDQFDELLYLCVKEAPMDIIAFDKSFLQKRVNFYNTVYNGSIGLKDVSLSKLAKRWKRFGAATKPVRVGGALVRCLAFVDYESGELLTKEKLLFMLDADEVFRDNEDTALNAGNNEIEE